VKIKILKCDGTNKWYKNHIGETMDVAFENTNYYFAKGIEFGIDKTDVEVVEVEKSCESCKWTGCSPNTMKYCTNKNQYFYWEKGESAERKIAKDIQCTKCGWTFTQENSETICCLCKRELSKSTEDKFRKIELEKDLPLVDRSCANCGYTRPCDRCRDSNLTEWIPCELMESDCGQAEPPKPFSREDLTNEINQSCDDIKKLFTYKNTEYGMDQDAFANFRKTAERMVIPFMARYGVTVDIKDAMYLVLSIYVDKHAVSLSQTGLSGNEVAERLGDIANYSLIAKAMLKGG